jgi:shikimate dehydrogenase
MNISSKTKICMVIGDPIEHSLSPQMHNAGYKKLGIDSDFVYVASRVSVDRIPELVAGIKAMNIRGVSCTIPHKVEVMKYLDDVDSIAKKIGSVNTIVNEKGLLKGYNTDWLGVVSPIEKIVALKGKNVALLGAGGAARAVAYGVTQRGAKLVIFNRTLKKAQQLAIEFGGKALPLESLSDVKNMDIIFNATSVGLLPGNNATPIPKDFIHAKHIVFDAIYVPYETRLLREAKDQGATVIHGMEMLLQQGVAQFKLYTSHDAPEATMRQVLLRHLRIKGEIL